MHESAAHGDALHGPQDDDRDRAATLQALP